LIAPDLRLADRRALPPPHEQVRTQRHDAITDDRDSDRSRTGRLFARALCHDLAAVMPTVALVAPLFGKALVERTKIDHNSLLFRCRSPLCRRLPTPWSQLVFHRRRPPLPPDAARRALRCGNWRIATTAAYPPCATRPAPP